MPHQDGFRDNGPEATGLSKPDDGDDRMQKKSENVAHPPDGIKRKNLKNSVRLRNSPTTASSIRPVRPCSRLPMSAHARPEMLPLRLHTAPRPPPPPAAAATC